MINTKQIISGTQSLKLWLNGRQTRASGFETLLQNKLKNVILVLPPTAFKSDTEGLYILPSTSSIAGLHRTWGIIIFPLPITEMKRQNF